MRTTIYTLMVPVFSMLMATAGAAEETPLSGTSYDDVIMVMMGVDGSEPGFTVGGMELSAVRVSADTMTDPANPMTPIRFSEAERCVFIAEPEGVGRLLLDARKGLDWKLSDPTDSPLGGRWLTFTATSSVSDMRFQMADGRVMIMDMPRPYQTHGSMEKFVAALSRLRAKCG